MGPPAPEPESDDDLLKPLECLLAGHHGEQHYGLVCELDGRDTGAVWARWTDSKPPSALVTLADCPRLDPRGDACVLFAGHEGDH